tara:strand:+ start:47528 stop:48055 length:528 start_codon:yes stop_codon:yes gene_type:complete
MAKYALVEDNEIKGVYDNLPKTWRNISNFDALQGDTSTLKSFGWEEIQHPTQEYDKTKFKKGNVTHTLVDGKVVESKTLITKNLPNQQFFNGYELTDSGPTEEDIAYQWKYVREDRDRRMKEVDWKILRYQREVRLEETPTDDIVKLDTYMQSLANITKQSDPFNIIWPILDSES